MSDGAHMRSALALARRGLGQTWPNPSVGCVIVAEGRVVGRARTADGGRPHAEALALAMAGAAARGATAYVTLEPCAHRGQTPPCVEALIAAGLARVVIASRDVDPRVNGAGVARLRAAGVDVTEGVLNAEADALQAGFFTRLRLGRPLVTLKLASTLDGRIATGSGESRWITGEAARRAAHGLRGRHDAVMVGVGTVLADDPDLTCRIAGYAARPPVRVVVDSHLRIGLRSRLAVSAAAAPVWVIGRDGADPARREALEQLGATLIEVAGSEAGVDVAAALAALGARGVTRVLLEGGARLAGSMLRAGLVDRVVWFHAPSVMGGDGWAAVQGFGVGHLAEMPGFRRVAAAPVGDDWMTEYETAA